MISAELQELIQQATLLARRAVPRPSSGDLLTRRKGFGVEFYQLRNYVPGDDVRFIDWKSTSRLGSMMMRECIELAASHLTLIVDFSASMAFGGYRRKSEMAAIVAAVIANVARAEKSSIDLCMVTNVCTTLPISTEQGLAQAITSLFATKPEGVFASQDVIRHLGQRRSAGMVIIISDFIGLDSARIAAAVGPQADLALVQIVDTLEEQLPAHCAFLAQDNETGEQMVMAPSASQAVYRHAQQQKFVLDELCAQYRAALVVMHTNLSSAQQIVAALQPIVQLT